MDISMDESSLDGNSSDTSPVGLNSTDDAFSLEDLTERSSLRDDPIDSSASSDFSSLEDDSG